MFRKHPIRRAATVFCFFLIGICATFAQDRAAFTFALVSDTHVGTMTGAEDLEWVVHDLNGLRGVAFVIVSGDITEMGSNTQLELAKAILDSLQVPYHIIPGNHDAKWSESGCTEFSQLWRDDKFNFEYGGYRFIGCPSGPNMKMGDGHVPPEDMRWVDSVLTHLSDPHQPLIFVNHYPLDSQLDNSYLILDTLRHYNTVAILCGHGHRNKAFEFDGIPGTMGRSSLRAAQPVGGYNLVHLRNDSLVFSERIPGVETKTPWRAFRLQPPAVRKDSSFLQEPDYSVNDQFPDVQERWKVATGYSIGSAPAVWDNLAIVGNAGGTVAAYSIDDGSVHWSFRTSGSVYSSPAVSLGKVVFGSADGNIYCLDANDGKPDWKVKTGEAVVASPVIHDGVVFIGSSDSVFRAIDLASGKIRWSYSGLQGFVETRPLVYEGKIIFGAWDTFLYALDEQTGALVWKWSNENLGRLYSPAACWPVASCGKVFIVAPDRYMTALDANSGNVVWRSGKHKVREMIGISQDTSRIYVRLMNDSLLAFSPAPDKPVLLWSSDCKYGYDIDPSMPVEEDGRVMFGTKNGLIFGVQASTGDVVWKHKLGNTVVNTLNPLSGQRILATTLDGTIALLRISEHHHAP